jgi:phosphatidate cytidylyltransferase
LSAGHTTPSEGHAPGYRAIRFNMDWITRPLFGLLLAGIAVAVVLSGPVPFAIAIAICFAFAAREWHRCVGGGASFNIETAVTVATLAVSEAALLYSGRFWVASAVAALGTVVAAGLALWQDKHPLWQGAGVLYLSVPALALLSLRLFPPHGAVIVVGLFIIVWATDTGALICGNLIGGPRLAPKLSPGKTWAGTIGGSLVGGLAFSLYISMLMGGAAPPAFVFGFVFSFAAHAGDLLESLVKRRFGLKNSGAAIPGHGGVLDRIDSTLMAGPVMALLVFVAHFDPLFGVHA